MRKWMKVAGWTAAVLLLAAGGGVLAGLQLADSRMHRKVEVRAPALAYVSDAQAIERGH